MVGVGCWWLWLFVGGRWGLRTFLCSWARVPWMVLGLRFCIRVVEVEVEDGVEDKDDTRRDALVPFGNISG